MLTLRLIAIINKLFFFSNELYSIYLIDINGCWSRFIRRCGMFVVANQF